MKFIYRDLRHGVVKLRVECLDDLWYLSQTVRPGDVVKAVTQRRVKDRDDVKSSGGERRTFTLSVRVEKLEFQPDSGSLRVSGVIEAGPEDLVGIGSHHTLNVDLGSEVTVVKEQWSKTELSRIEEAVSSTLRPRVLVVVVEDGEAVLGLLRESGVGYAELSRNIGGKYDLGGRAERLKSFHGELAQMVGGSVEKNNVSVVVLAGPGFAKDGFMEYLKGCDRELASKFVVEDTGSGGRAGVQEVLKRDVIHKALEQVNSVRDVRLLEEVLRHVGSGSGLAAYGVEEVRGAVGSGAVNALLVSDRLFLEARDVVEPLMFGVRNQRGLSHIVNHDSDAGRQLESLGGLAALLRYRIG